MHRTSSSLALLTLFLPLLGHAQLEGGEANVSPQPLQREWLMPRTEHGHPDLQGTWWFGSRTPLQRPVNLGRRRQMLEQLIDRAETERCQHLGPLLR